MWFISGEKMKELEELKECDMHLVQVVNVGGKRIKIWYGSSGLSAFMNELAMTGEYKIFHIGQSKVIRLPNGFGVWLLPDSQDFATHYWIEGEQLTMSELTKLILWLEEEEVKEREELER